MLVIRGDKLVRVSDKPLIIKRLSGVRDDELRQALGEYRLRQGLSYKRLAERVGVYTDTVWHWLKGKRRPGKLARSVLGRLLKVDGFENKKNRGRQSTTPQKNLDLSQYSTEQKLKQEDNLVKLKKEKKNLNNRIRRVKAKKNSWARAAAQRRKEEGPSSKNLGKWRREKGLRGRTSERESTCGLEVSRETEDRLASLVSEGSDTVTNAGTGQEDPA